MYEGEYLNGEKNGKGVYYYEERIKYEGEFVANKKEGKDVFYWDEKTKREAIWVNDKMSHKLILASIFILNFYVFNYIN